MSAWFSWSPKVDNDPAQFKNKGAVRAVSAYTMGRVWLNVTVGHKIQGLCVQILLIQHGTGSVPTIAVSTSAVLRYIRGIRVVLV